ncbi:Hypothetical protein LUCI_4413 [Lucifera butyrica]|uniref:SGNH hydrolase-type esterase domain-containing protein n=1 Tax=Lucifera butyrica TaxID=1351585 RepID=A0A498RDX3_9FIRM|nr:GDSL-type esterase/lipase family protein [Lucifera butyrica]VBB09127.1 Hypothetical protein LUCI_4413 [Lucifera butyrica]
MQDKRIKLVALGDSITAGFPYTPESSWFNLIAERLRIEHVNRGIDGDTTAGMLRRFNRDALSFEPSHVIILGGTNDAYEGIAAEEVIYNIQAMVNLAVKRGVRPILGLPITCDDPDVEYLLGRYRETIQCYAAENHIVGIDFTKAMADANGKRIKAELYCDGVHPNKEGYQSMARVAGDVLGKLINLVGKEIKK